MEVEDRYYTSKEYNKLTNAQRQKLSQLWKARKKKSNKKQKKEGGNQTLKKMTKQIAALTAALANSVGLNQQNGDSTDNDNADDSQGGNGQSTTDGGNRNNSALTRQGRR